MSSIDAKPQRCNDVCGPISEQLAAFRHATKAPPIKKDITLPGLVSLFDWDQDSTHRVRVRPNRKLAFTLDGVLTPAECNKLIAAAEGTGSFQPAGVGSSGKQEVSRTVRTSDRLISEDPRLAALLFSRVRDHLPVCFKGCHVVGLNEQLKFLKYGPGQFFKPHFDGSFERPGTGNTTYLTLQLYLSHSLDGGATRFVAPMPETDELPQSLRGIDCAAKQGRALVFQHDILHEGAPVVTGTKYTIRTDVEYGPRRFRHQLREAIGLGGSARQTRLRMGGVLAVMLASFALIGLSNRSYSGCTKSACRT
mmetsp:Transcript_43047/g.71557  ORF Transcript_43047/g.71557 Transcript_43047/m.71557 type:complete len:308 (-) Transcript_43047:81-1004(-)|eukprot:CAMPEP_0119316958 /NCGR_PEP_ID=MMETSP1333-20130426/41480_1 /TAXON_ID=418940 /ORGANISM="Scyphosphaera apsteinii, Strain RCC1455" /LENGTH=307 /DNA_ID=CAMNT_0007322747 /DNA_START=68 /DNA_END=991 /DNA_ORIENTATION=-